MLRIQAFGNLRGGRGIRTPGPRERTTVFKTAAFDHSAIPPGAKLVKFQDWEPGQKTEIRE